MAVAIWQRPVFDMGPAPERSKKLESAARRINRLRSSSSHMPWWLALDALMEIGHQLDEHNFIILDDFSAAMAAIRDDVHASLKHCRDDDDATKDTRSAARIGDASRSGRVSALRSDLSIWARIGSSSSSGSASVLNRPSRPALDSLADDAEALVSALRDNAPGTDTPHNDASVSALAFARTRRQLANVRWRSDAMLACYPRNGSRYVRHLDNVCTAGGEGATCNGRRLTLVYYLNERARDVRSRDAGGELRIFRPGPPTSDPLIDVEPLANRLALFWSDDRTPHAVLPTGPHHDRFAVTLWFFDEGEVTRATQVHGRDAPELRRLRGHSDAEDSCDATADAPERGRRVTDDSDQ